MHTIIARMQMQRQKLSEAVDSAEKALTLAKQLDKPELIARNYLCLAAALYQQGHYAQAIAQIQLARPLCSTLPLLNALCDQYLASIHYHKANYTCAQQLYTAALSFYKNGPENYPKQRSVVINNLGNVALRLGHFEESRHYYEQSVHLRKLTNGRASIALVALANLGLVALSQQRFDAAQNYLHSALQAARRSGQAINEARTLGYLSEYKRLLGAFDVAKQYAQQDLAILEQIDRLGMRSVRLTQLARICLELGELTQAIEYSEQALHYAERQNEKHAYAVSLTLVGDVQVAVGSFDAAVAAYQHALTLRQELGQQALASEPLAGLAAIALKQGQPTSALQFIAPILQHLKQHSLDGTADRYHIYLICHDVLVDSEPAMARQLLERAIKVLRQAAASIADPHERARFLKRNGQCKPNDPSCI
ncbi:MAG TPA: tetratricopeptide repeat protein [Anaerolineae bacterium]|nr:tetratricopeptide repeat protein [Anaerolineae bacterium]